MTLHPSRFPKHRDGKRFRVRIFGREFQVYAADLEHIALCPTPEKANMIAAALEFQARDGETFILENGK